MGKFETTDKQILEAFAALLESRKSLTKITVTELAESAGVTRATFYAHYDNVHSVAMAFERELLELLELGRLDIKNPRALAKYFDRLFDFLRENESIYRQLLTSDSAYIFVKNINAKIYDKILEDISDNVTRKQLRELELDIRFFIDGAIYLIMRYFRSETNQELDDIQKYLQKKFKTLVLTRK